MASNSADSTETEFQNIASYTECDSAKVTGVGVVVNVSDMSPSKKGTDYFHATLHDGVEQTGFRKRQRDLLKEFEENGKTVDISACKIKKSKFAEDFNVQLATNTAFTTSPQKLSIDRNKFSPNSDVQLCDLANVLDGTRVSSVIKVLRLESKATVSGGQSLQNVIIADSTEANKIVLWNDDIGKLEEGKCYHLKLKSYKKEKSLQYPNIPNTVLQLKNWMILVQWHLTTSLFTIILSIQKLQVYYLLTTF